MISDNENSIPVLVFQFRDNQLVEFVNVIGKVSLRILDCSFTDIINFLIVRGDLMVLPSYCVLPRLFDGCHPPSSGTTRFDIGGSAVI